MAQALEERSPDKFTSNIRKQARKGRIFIDYLRNGFGPSAIAPYSVRNRAGAPVACPIDWKELTSKLKSDSITMNKAIARLKKKDPWKGIFKLRQEIEILN